MDFAFEIWWGCLNPRESRVLNELVRSSILVPLYVTKIEFQLLWAVRGIDLDNPFVAAFMASYYLSYATIPIPPLDEVEVVLMDSAFWLYFKAFSLTSEYASPPVCKILVFTN